MMGLPERFVTWRLTGWGKRYTFVGQGDGFGSCGDVDTEGVDAAVVNGCADAEGFEAGVTQLVVAGAVGGSVAEAMAEQGDGCRLCCGGEGGKRCCGNSQKVFYCLGVLSSSQ